MRLEDDPNGSSRYRVDFWYDHPLTGERERFRRLSPHTSQRKAYQWGATWLTRVTDRNYWLEKAEREAEEKIPTIAEWKDEFIRRIKRDPDYTSGTVTNYESKLRNHVIPALGDKRLDKVTSAEVGDLIVSLRDSYADNTVRATATALGSMYSMAVKRQLITKADRPDIDAPRQKPVGNRETPKFLDQSEVQRLLDNAPGRVKVMMTLALRTGMRIGELQGLVWDVVDWDRMTISILRQWTRGCSHVPEKMPLPKGGKTRVVPVTQQTLDMLQEHRESRWAGDRFVFSFKAVTELDVYCPPEHEGTCLEPIHKSRLRSVTETAFRHANVEPAKRGWHCLRHTFAARLATKGVSLRLIQKLLGHASITTTEIYADLLPSATEKARDYLDELGM